MNALLLLAAACATQTPQPSGDYGEAPQIYTQYCAQCHGSDMRGGMAGSLVDGVWTRGNTVKDIRETIKFGATSMGMPAFSDTLENAQIARLSQYVYDTWQAYIALDPIHARPLLPKSTQTLDYNVDVQHVFGQLDEPWGIAFADSDTILITEKPGRLRMFRNEELVPEPIAGTPEVLYQAQAGLMDVAVDPNHGENGWIYLSFTHPWPEPNEQFPKQMTKIVRGRIENHRWVDEQTVFQAREEHYLKSRGNLGSRIVFDDEGYLYFSIGDCQFEKYAQDLGSPVAKVHRLHRDGSIPEDNPFVNSEGALPSIYSLGNRNIQGMVFHPETGVLWATEHGPMGGDELNSITGGGNYGWPVITYGREYTGRKISEETSAPGMLQPVWHWTPSIAVCGLDVVQGEEFPRWRNRLLVGALRTETLRLLTLNGERVIHEEVIVSNWGRIRDVACGPSGAIYILIEGSNILVKLMSAGERTYGVD